MKVEFKHESYGEDWQERECDARFLDLAAEEIASEYFHEDPTAPHRFEFIIEIRRAGENKSIKYIVGAEADVNFYTIEINHDKGSE